MTSGCRIAGQASRLRDDLIGSVNAPLSNHTLRQGSVKPAGEAGMEGRRYGGGGCYTARRAMAAALGAWGRGRRGSFSSAFSGRE